MIQLKNSPECYVGIFRLERGSPKQNETCFFFSSDIRQSNPKYVCNRGLFLVLGG